MEKKEFDAFIKDALAAIDAKLVGKGIEYNHESDRLGFFKRAARLQDIEPEQALFGFMLKHIVSVSDMVKEGRPFALSLWEEKLLDIIDYCLLLLALEKEKLDD